MFEKHEIWERTDDYIVIYVVFRDLDTGLYHVHQANFLSTDASLEDIRETMATHNYYVADLLLMRLPSEASPGFTTIREAVAAHKREFADMPPA